MRKLSPVHKSLYVTENKIRALKIRKPHNMDRTKGLSEVEIQAATETSLGIFTDCVNVGVPFQDALTAIYMSGIQHTLSVLKEKNKNG